MNVALLAIMSTAAGVVLPAIVTWLKTAPWFTWVSADQSGRVKALAAFLAALSAFLFAWQSGALDQTLLLALGTTALALVHTLGISTLIHHWFGKKQ